MKLYILVMREGYHKFTVSGSKIRFKSALQSSLEKDLRFNPTTQEFSYRRIAREYEPLTGLSPFRVVENMDRVEAARKDIIQAALEANILTRMRVFNTEVEALFAEALALHKDCRKAKNKKLISPHMRAIAGLCKRLQK